MIKTKEYEMNFTSTLQHQLIKMSLKEYTDEFNKAIKNGYSFDEPYKKVILESLDSTDIANRIIKEILQDNNPNGYVIESNWIDDTNNNEFVFRGWRYNRLGLY